MTEPAVLTLTDFLLARIFDDAWQAAGAVEYRRSHPGWEPADRRWEMDDGLVAVGPERALAECEAKRRIVELHHASEGQLTNQGPVCAVCACGLGDGWDLAMDCREDFPCPSLRALALPYAAHQDFRKEWAPHAVG